MINRREAMLYAEEEALADKRKQFIHKQWQSPVFMRAEKCKCGGQLVLTRKYMSDEFYICKKCKKRFVRNVFDATSSLKEATRDEESC